VTTAVVLAISVFTAALLSAAIGLGGGTLLIACFYMVLPPAVALPLHGAVQVVNNGTRLWVFRRHIDRAIVSAFLLALGPAVVLGFWVFNALAGEASWALRGLLGGFILVSVFYRPMHRAELERRGWLGVGFVATLSSMVVGAADPVLAPFFLNDRFDRLTVIGTKAACQLATHIPKVALFALIPPSPDGFHFTTWAAPLAGLSALAVAGVVAGRHLAIPEPLFRTAYRVVLVLLGTKLLVVDGVINGLL
jgi:uncharacterized membrane protein YfcA